MYTKQIIYFYCFITFIFAFILYFFRATSEATHNSDLLGRLSLGCDSNYSESAKNLDLSRYLPAQI